MNLEIEHATDSAPEPPRKRYIPPLEVGKLAGDLVNRYLSQVQQNDHVVRVYGIPRGGIPVMYAVAAALAKRGYLVRYSNVPLDEPGFLIVDDIEDTGTTARRYKGAYPQAVFQTLVKRSAGDTAWYVFPWEEVEGQSVDNSIVGTLRNRIIGSKMPFNADSVVPALSPGERLQLVDEVERRCDHLLRGLLIDVDNDPNSKGTARRMAKMYVCEVLGGRFTPPPNVTTFPNDDKTGDQVYTIGPISLRSMCAHHFCPIVGSVWIGIVASQRLGGLSKFSRIVDWIARRGHLQESLTTSIADAVQSYFDPKGIAVVVKADHLCMQWRGVEEHDAHMSTSTMRGVFRDNPSAREEFFQLIK